MASVFLKFLYTGLDGCLGSGPIGLFDQNGTRISYTKIKSIPYDDFKADNPTTAAIFNTAGNRWWTSNPATCYFIAELDVTGITRISKIGITTWGNTVYPRENIVVYMSDKYNGTYKQIASLSLDSKTHGTSKMVYVTTNSNANIITLCSKITLNQTSATIKTKDQLQLTATIEPSNANNKSLTWSSSNESVATVDSTGLITGVHKGTCIITASSTDGSNIKATCNLEVELPISQTIKNTVFNALINHEFIKEYCIISKKESEQT